MGSGKSTIGRLLANTLKTRFIDLDHEIESAEKKTITEIFALYGENVFREMENNYLKKLFDNNNQVIAVGGGTPCFHNNMDLMNENGKTIYLKMGTQALLDRFSSLSAQAKQSRPLIANKTKKELEDFISLTLQKREPFYEKAKIVVFNEDTNSMKTVDRILMAL